ncbi:MAG TPA: DinB family protein [Thermoanaerobaculia bacterium]|nr:DinB family protein [Thermoanaerobaculia bacterium]
MSDVLGVLLAALDAAYDRHGWHGTTLRNAVRRVRAEEALWRPGEGRHNIWELTVHAAYWKSVARRRLTGGKRGGFPMKGSNWIAAPPDANWEEAVALLESEHAAWRAAVASVDPAALDDPKKVRLVYGVTAHDVYHTGQIQLVRALRAARFSRSRKA